MSFGQYERDIKKNPHKDRVACPKLDNHPKVRTITCHVKFLIFAGEK